MILYNSWFRAGLTAASFALVTIDVYCVEANLPIDAFSQPQSTSVKSIGDQLQALTEAVDEAETAMINNTNHEAKDDLWEKYSRLNRESLPKIFELVALEPKSEAAATALGWVAANRIITSGNRELKHFGREAVEALLADHIKSPKIGRVCWLLGENWSGAHPPTVKFLEAVGENNPDRNIRGQAKFALARMKKEWSENLGYFETVPATEFADPTTFIEGCKVMAPFGNSQDCANQAKILFDEVLKDYADADVPAEQRIRHARSTLGEEAEKELFEFTRLARQSEAPEIEGEDLEGHAFKLSDYRGKIVLLSFWASWCGPCMQLVDREKPLVARMAGKPFAVIGVNGDSSLKNALSAVERERMTWRSFRSGEKGANGLIPDTWNIRHWPTLYLLDQQGVIRVKDGNLKYIEKVIDQLLAKTEATKT